MMKLLLMEQGWLPFHSAACRWNDTGICILGGKFAGKTSTLINLLAQPGAGFVSNDTLFLRDGGTFLEGCGFPNKAGLRIGALVANPKLVDWIDRTTDSFYPQIDAETFHDIVATTPADELGTRSEKIVLLSTELAEQLESPSSTSRPLRSSSSSSSTPRSSSRGWHPSRSRSGSKIPGRELPQPEQGEAGLSPALLRLRRQHAASRPGRPAGEVLLEGGGP